MLFRNFQFCSILAKFSNRTVLVVVHTLIIYCSLTVRRMSGGIASVAFVTAGRGSGGAGAGAAAAASAPKWVLSGLQGGAVLRTPYTRLLAGPTLTQVTAVTFSCVTVHLNCGFAELFIWNGRC